MTKVCYKKFADTLGRVGECKDKIIKNYINICSFYIVEVLGILDDLHLLSLQIRAIMR